MQNSKTNIYISSTDLRLFATMIKSGISPVEAISGISEKYGGKLRRQYEYLKEKLAEGINFSEVFQETVLGKNSLYINLLSGAESSGNIPEVLEQIALSIESGKQRRDQIIGVVIYPAIVLIMVTLLILTLLLFIVPNILPVIAMSGDNLPFATKALVFLSEQLKEKWLHLIIAIVLILLALMLFVMFRPLRIVFEKIILKIPIINNFVISYLSLGYTLALYQSLTSTSDIAGVIKDLTKGSGSEVFKNEFINIESKIRQGMALHAAFYNSKHIPPIWSLFSKVAEQTSSYSVMFKNLHEYYKEVFDSTSKLVMKLAEPILMITIGIIVGILAYGIMAPLYGIMNSLK